jgi:iron-sulfur cluster repair protein YtfE (RIC family)
MRRAAPSAMSPSPPAELLLYGPVHRALRLLMHATLQRLGRMDCSRAAELTPALAQLQLLLDLLRSHLQQENDFMHPALEARRPGSSRAVAQEHEAQLEAIEALETEAQALAASAPAERAALAQRLRRALARLVAGQLLHMREEEDGLAAQLRAGYRSEELRALQELLLARIPAAELALLRRWMAAARAPAGLCAG